MVRWNFPVLLLYTEIKATVKLQSFTTEKITSIVSSSGYLFVFLTEKLQRGSFKAEKVTSTSVAFIYE